MLSVICVVAGVLCDDVAAHMYTHKCSFTQNRVYCVLDALLSGLVGGVFSVC